MEAMTPHDLGNSEDARTAPSNVGGGADVTGTPTAAGTQDNGPTSCTAELSLYWIKAAPAAPPGRRQRSASASEARPSARRPPTHPAVRSARPARHAVWCYTNRLLRPGYRDQGHRIDDGHGGRRGHRLRQPLVLWLSPKIRVHAGNSVSELT